jgi:hypothetical protein
MKSSIDLGKDHYTVWEPTLYVRCADVFQEVADRMYVKTATDKSLTREESVIEVRR